MILVTAFEPFGGFASNPSEDVARTLEEIDVDAVVLPVDLGRAKEMLVAHKGVLDQPWDAVLMLGLAADRPGFSLERVARNRFEARDAAATVHAGEVLEGGPAAYFSTLPLPRLQRALAELGLAATISSDAGTFLCNAAFYLARHHLARRRTPCGFLHLPPTPELVDGADGMGGVALTDQVNAVRRLVAVLRGHA